MIEFTRLAEISDRRPLIHCISNIVTANDCANLALAVGAGGKAQQLAAVSRKKSNIKRQANMHGRRIPSAASARHGGDRGPRTCHGRKRNVV